MKRPESRLAAGGLLCALAVAMLVSVSLVSCEDVGMAGRGGVGPGTDPGSGGGEVVVAPVAPNPGVGSMIGGPADYRVAVVGPEPEMRVRVLTATERVVIGGGGGGANLRVMVGEAGKGGGRESLIHGPVVVRRTAGGWALTAQVGGAAVAEFPQAVAVAFATGVADGEITINGSAYPGRVWLVPRSEVSERAFDAIEHVPLEEYLPGVVAKEMFTGWPLAAYQVQAVCARTYALHERVRTLNSARRASFDVESNERDQAYAGATRNRAATEAVRSTRGWVLADGDRLLRAYYSSTCGGRTAAAAETWPTGPGFEFNLAGPIQANAREWACQNAPLYRWTVKRDRAELVQRLRAFGDRFQVQVRQIGDLWAIEPMAAYPSGRPSAYKVIEPGGRWFRLSGEQMRLALNQSVPSYQPRAAINVGPAVAAPTIGIGAEGDADLVGPAPATVEMVPDIDRRSRVASSDLEVTGPKGAAAVTISGRGFGHGVGMCQYCTKAFADRGEDWRTIVGRFYPGARLLAAY